MKKIILAVTLLITTASCTFSNQYGDCISPFEDGNPNLEYKVSIRNTVWSIIGLETIIAPVLWATSCGKCPVGPARK